MGPKKGALTARAWRFLRLALIWARKGGALKHSRFVRNQLRLLRNCVKTRPSDRLQYGERQFSFDDTPTFHFKLPGTSSMRHLRVPCINPEADEDDYGDNDGNYFLKTDKRSFYCYDDVDGEEEVSGRVEEVEEEEVDAKAEEFIAKFYDQMRLQRQISLLQYNEMMRRSII